MHIKQIMPAPGWRVFEAWRNSFDEVNESVLPHVEPVSVIGWGIEDSDDEHATVVLLLCQDGIVMTLPEWRTANEVEEISWAYVAAPPHQTDEEAREELVINFRDALAAK